MRLQNLIQGWQGSQRGEELTALHTLCVEIAGRENALLPARLYLTPELDSASLARTLRQTSASVRFQTPPRGRFDAALVPTGKGDGPLDRFVLVIEALLPVRDQAALYAHAVGHLLLNYQNSTLERGLNLDPDSGMTHVERLADLRYVEMLSNRNKANREVLQTFPLLAELAEPPVENRLVMEAATRELLPRLEALGWLRGRELLLSPYEYTAGRVLTERARRGRKRTIDVLLRASFSLPVAVVHAQRAGQSYEEGRLWAQDAAVRLNVPFAYLVETNGAIHEIDFLQGEPPGVTRRADLPAHEELVGRWLEHLGLKSWDERRILLQPYQQGRLPRYYQDAAINRALIAILQARRGLRPRRLLLTLATGTGKTRVAFQLLWKLKQAHAVGNMLFLADRGYLLNQASRNEFAPFRDAIWRGQGESKTSRDLLFASYQWMTTMQDGRYHYQDYPAEFFDVIIVDECHRGSASEDSSWRQVLEYFTPAIQVGMTATPLRSKSVQTAQYFGEAVYTYALSRGIEDGFLAPYRVRRVLVGEHTRTPQPDASSSPSFALPPGPDPFREEGVHTELADALVMETSEAMRRSTPAIAAHLARYLEATERQAKTIVFCADNEHAQEMRDALRKECTDWARPESIVRIVNDDGVEGEQALYDFCATNTRQPVVVTTARLLSTGIDAPMCKNIVLARGVGSMVEFKQIIGRGTRLFGQEKTWFAILDYAGAMKHFFDPEFDGNPEFITNEPLSLQPDPAGTVQHGQEVGSGEPSAAVPADLTCVDVQAVQGEEQARSTRFPAIEEEMTAHTLAYAYDIAPVPGAKSGQTGGATEGADPCVTSSGKQPESDDGVEEEAAVVSSLPGPSASSSPSSERAVAGELAGKELEASRVMKEGEDGSRVVVLDERLFELGPDNRLRRSGTGQEWAKEALQNVVGTPGELRAGWSDRLSRRELLAALDEQAVPVERLAVLLHLEEMDPFDVLLRALFDLPALTRDERVARLRQKRQDFFARFTAVSLATRVLDAVLDWYMHVPLAELSEASRLDVSNPELLELPTLACLGMPLDIATAFRTCGLHIETALEELQRLLYSV